MKEINILYIDDMIDERISKYIAEIYINEPQDDIIKKYHEFTFNYSDGYESLLGNTAIKQANIILIDNRLFEQDQASSGKFTGKQFKVLLRKLYPFIEVLVISQFNHDDGYKMIPKFNSSAGSAEEHYASYLRPELDKSINQVIAFEKLSDELKMSEDVKTELIERVMLSIKGDESYSTLDKSDIDQLITTFKELKEQYNGL